MSTSNLKTRFRDFVEFVFNQKDTTSLDSFLAHDAYDHTPPEGFARDREAIKSQIQAFLAAFPDCQVDIQLMVEEGDLLVAHNIFTGTHKAELMGIPATGQPVKYSETHIVRYRDGLIIEHWYNGDDLGMMQQLGLVPA